LRRGIAETTPCEKINEPTPISISDTPKVSHLARERGKTGKSTAMIASIVMSIIWDRYTVRAGSGLIVIWRKPLFGAAGPFER